MNKKDLRIPSSHKLIQTKMENKVKKSEDYDLYYYDEFDAESNLVSKYIVKHTTSIYPPFSVYVEYQKFALDDLDKQNIFFDRLIADELLKKKGVTNLSEKVLKIVSQNIIELFDNAREHSKSSAGIYIAGQFFPQKHKFDFTIVDMGVGIVENVNLFLGKKLESGEAIFWAMQKQNSTRVGEPGGLGLALLKELILKSNGKIEIISNDGYYFIKDQKESYENLEISK